MPPKDIELLADFLGQGEYSSFGASNATIARAFIDLLNDKEYSWYETEETEENLLLASLHPTYHGLLQQIAGNLRDVGLCRNAEFDNMMEILGGIVPDADLFAGFYLYPWHDVKRAHLRVSKESEAEKASSKEGREQIAGMEAAGQKMILVSELIAKRLDSYAIRFECKPNEDFEAFAGKAVSAMKALGIPEDIDALLSGSVPADDILA